MIKEIFHKRPSALIPAMMTTLTMGGGTPSAGSYWIGNTSIRHKGMKSLPGTRLKREKRKLQTLARKRNR